jgi:hypothetical protein
MPRFVLLQHEMPPGSSLPGVHWDFMLEVDGALRTWRLEVLPTTGCAIAAESLADHRLSYLDYEGPVSGDRGFVAQIDAGNYRWLSDHADRVVVRLSGKLLSGDVALQKSNAENQRWTFSFTPSTEDSCRAAD